MYYETKWEPFFHLGVQWLVFGHGPLLKVKRQFYQVSAFRPAVQRQASQGFFKPCWKLMQQKDSLRTGSFSTPFRGSVNPSAWWLLVHISVAPVLTASPQTFLHFFPALNIIPIFEQNPGLVLVLSLSSDRSPRTAGNYHLILMSEYYLKYFHRPVNTSVCWYVCADDVN